MAIRKSIFIDFFRAKKHTGGQKYSPFLGLLNQFEMLYVIGSERDLIGARIGKRKEEVICMKRRLLQKWQKKILISFVEDINLLSEKPRFYNTLWHNCTTAMNS